MSSEKKQVIAIGSDHGGFTLKSALKSHLQQQGFTVTDCGTDSTDAVDYPKFAHAVASEVSSARAAFGVIVDGAGIGSAMAANKVQGVRAALCYDLSTAVNAREHNNANIVTLGAGLTGPVLARQIVDTFLATPCTEDRHLRRVRMIDALDTKDSPFTKNTNSIREDNVTELSSDDITRIAKRVSEMLSNAPENPTGSCETDMVCVCGVCMERKPETLRQFLDYGVERLGYHNATGCECVPNDIAGCIDHTLLKQDATENDIRKLCSEAREYGFASVCVSPSYVPLAARELQGSQVEVCTVVGFPSGAHLPEIKGLETRRAIRDGAGEIDMVINIGALKSGNDELVYRDIRIVCEACEDGGAVSKVIIEAALLNDDEKRRACELAKKARANYVKTSTGFGPHGATVEDVRLMNEVVSGTGIGIKAAGGIKSYEDAQKMIAAGANRLGASAGIKILQEAKETTITS